MEMCYTHVNNRSDVCILLNWQVVCSCSAASATGFAESPLVLLTESPTRAKQKPVRAPILDLWTADLPAAGAVAVIVIPEVGILLDLTGIGLLPSVWVAAHLEEGRLFYGGGYFVLLGGHVLRVLLVRQVVVGESQREEVCRAHHTLAEVWRWGWWWWRRQRELSAQRGLISSYRLPAK